MSPIRTLVVADDPGTTRQICLHLLEPVYEIEAVASARAIDRVRRPPLPDIAVVDMAIPNGGCLELLQLFRRVAPVLKFIVLSSGEESRRTVQAIRLGAENFVSKPYTRPALEAAIQDCLPAVTEAVRYRELPGDVEELDGRSFFVGASPAMRQLRAQLDQMARVDIPVLCLGESGTGKEVIARMVHRLSMRSRQLFLKVNCAAVPAELLESELFGYERGAFTGANRSKPGKFEVCNKGTLFLDEIAEMPPALQAKLLHVLQDQEFTRLGGCSRVKVDVRIVAATNVNMKEALAFKSFRQDLYYRLSAFVFSLPPLRERREDIPILLQRYLAFYAQQFGVSARGLSRDLWDQCIGYSWPGNVRELENFVKRYLVFGEEAVFTDGALKTDVETTSPKPSGPTPADLKVHVRDLKNGAEVSAIANALEQANWNRKEAARLLNISYKSLLTKIQQYQIGHADKATALRAYAGR